MCLRWTSARWRCAKAIVERVDEHGVEVRAGLHTGEIESYPDGDIGGMAVNIGARVCSVAGGGQVLVSSTVKDLVIGSRLQFSSRGAHQLKGVPGDWSLWSYDGEDASGSAEHPMDEMGVVRRSYVNMLLKRPNVARKISTRVFKPREAN